MTVHLCRDLVIGSPSNVGQWGAATGSFDTMWAMAVFMQGVLGYTYESSGGGPLPPSYSDFIVNYYHYNGSSLAVVSSSILSIHSASCFLSSSGGHTLVVFSKDTFNLNAAAFPTSWVGGAWPGFLPSTTNLGAGYGDPLKYDWIAIKSAQYPLANSGIFRIIDTTSWLSVNAVEIDFRTTTAVQQEITQFLTCSIWLPPPSTDFGVGTLPAGTGSFYGLSRGQVRTGFYWPSISGPAGWASNGNSNGYQGNGSSTYPRMILTSPHSTAYQVRLAIETSQDMNFGGVQSNDPALSMIPGFSGSGGDFQTGSFNATNTAFHLHPAQWLNYSFANAGNYIGSLPVFDYFRNTNDTTFHGIWYRFFAVGDDTTGSVFAAIRNVSGSNEVCNSFGIPEDETYPNAPLPVQRLWCFGSNAYLPGAVDINAGMHNSEGMMGMAYSWERWRGPISCVPAQYVNCAQAGTAYYSGFSGPSGAGGNPRYDIDTGDTPFLQASELIDLELWAGTYEQMYYWGNAGFTSIFPLEPRRLGRFPFIRLGRVYTGVTPLPTWTVGTLGSWFHMSNGVYLPWGGTADLGNPIS